MDRSRQRPTLPARASGFTQILLFAFALALAFSATAQEPPRPNIVLIVADYMGYADIGPYGAEDISTPSLDALARQGVRFSNYYAASPVCGPSRAALLSGRYPARTGLESNVNPDRGGMPASANTLVRELKAANYRTALVGKWHLGRANGYSPESHGFDRFFGFHTWTLGYHNHLTPTGNPGLFRGSEVVEEDGYLTDMLTDEAINFVQSSSQAPFFLYLAYSVALPPYQGPDLPRSQWSEGWDANEAKRSDYVAMVESMDQGIGRVLARLDELGLTQDTLVIFTYDHGGRHLVRSGPLFHGFGTLWEGGIRVPLIMKLPRMFPGGRTVERPSIAMDLTATMLALSSSGVASVQLDGTSLMPLLSNNEAVASQPLFWRHKQQGSLMKAVRHKNWKYVVDRGTQFLFDLDTDPGERRDRFSDHTDTVNALRGKLATWEQSVTADY